MQKTVLRFRPHHFMCTLGFQGKGYSVPFIRNYKKIVTQLTENQHSLIQVTNGLDNICHACPHSVDGNLCSSQDFIDKLDQAHQQILDLKEDQIITWVDAKKLIKTKMTIEKFHTACNGCEWKTYGVCEAALTKLISI